MKWRGSSLFWSSVAVMLCGSLLVEPCMNGAQDSFAQYQQYCPACQYCHLCPGGSGGNSPGYGVTKSPAYQSAASYQAPLLPPIPAYSPSSPCPACPACPPVTPCNCGPPGPKYPLAGKKKRSHWENDYGHLIAPITARNLSSRFFNLPPPPPPKAKVNSRRQ